MSWSKPTSWRLRHGSSPGAVRRPWPIRFFSSNCIGACFVMCGSGREPIERRTATSASIGRKSATKRNRCAVTSGIGKVIRCTPRTKSPSAFTISSYGFIVFRMATAGIPALPPIFSLQSWAVDRFPGAVRVSTWRGKRVADILPRFIGQTHTISGLCWHLRAADVRGKCGRTFGELSWSKLTGSIL